MSACLSVRMEQLCSHWTYFHEIWYSTVFRKSVEKIQFSLKSDSNSEYFTRKLVCIFDHISPNYSYNKNVLDQSRIENQNTFCVNNFFFSENRAVCEIMWKNIVEPQVTIRRMRIACWIPKATNTHSKYIIVIVFPLQPRLQERASLLPYRYTACLVSYVYKQGNCFHPTTNKRIIWNPCWSIWESGGQSDTGSGFRAGTSAFPSQHHLADASYSYPIYLLLTLPNVSSWQRR